jgi:hypothetical protein
MLAFAIEGIACRATNQVRSDGIEKHSNAPEESTMRIAFTSTGVAFTVFLSASVGYAQNKQSSPPPTANERAYETIWPTAEQEAAIPYRPCELAIRWDDRRLICWSTQRPRPE